MKQLIVRGLSETTYKKLLKKKEMDGFGEKDWSEWLEWLVRDVKIHDTMHEVIERTTAENLLGLWMENFAINLPKMRSPNVKTIADLVPEDVKKEPDRPHGSAVVIGAGPSIYRHNHLDLLAKSDYLGLIIATDRMLIPCLKKGIIPHLTVTVDGNREKIVKWYDDPIVDQYGYQLHVALSTNVAPNVVERLEKANANIYWFHPIFDDWRIPESFTRIMKLTTKTEKLPHGIPAVSVGGNTGSTCWVFAHALFRRSPVALIGIDFGYYADEPIEKTQYFKSLYEVTKNVELAKQLGYREIYNPYTKKTYITETIFLHYKEGFLEMLKYTPPWVRTINCTEGGILFGEGIEWMTFKQFLEEYKK